MNVESEVKSVANQNYKSFFIRIIPLSTLLFTWVDIHGMKQYHGSVYVYRNKFTCVVGLIIIFSVLLVQLNRKYKIIFNLLGNFLFWLPLFYGAFKQTNKIYNVSIMCYMSIAIVCICCLVQMKMIYTSN